MPKKEIKTMNLDDTFETGKYKGKTIKYVIDSNYHYIIYMLNLKLIFLSEPAKFYLNTAYKEDTGKDLYE